MDKSLKEEKSKLAGKLSGERFVLKKGEPLYPQAFLDIPQPPETIYGIGNVSAVRFGIAIVGARKATPYGLTCAQHFAELACKQGFVVISGGALGCDSAAHKGALSAHGMTVVILGGGCDCVYPAQNLPLFQEVIDKGGAVISEQDWEVPPLPWMFRLRNRLIAGLSLATLIVEAGLPSGTFSTADDALAASREVLVVPGAITSATSKGANRLIYQGAVPIIDDEVFLQTIEPLRMVENNIECCTCAAALSGSHEQDIFDNETASKNESATKTEGATNIETTTKRDTTTKSETTTKRDTANKSETAHIIETATKNETESINESTNQIETAHGGELGFELTGDCELENENNCSLDDFLVSLVRTQPYRIEDIFGCAAKHFDGGVSWGSVALSLIKAEALGLISHYEDGRWGPIVT